MAADRRVVLVVDDESITRDVVTALLELEGVDVHTAASGDEALAVAGEIHPDLVLLDVMMPGMDGFEVCRRLRSAEAPPRVVMLTATSGDAARRTAAEAGAESFLVKPFSARDVFRVLAGEQVA